MEANSLIRNILEIGIGLLFLIGAIFNSVYTFRHGEEFYGSFAENAILAPGRTLVRKLVIPHDRLFTILLIIFQLFVAFCILSRGELVVPGLIAGTVFCFAAALVSNTGGAIANLALAIGQLYLVITG